MARGKKIQITDDMSTTDRVVLCAAEVVGTAILVFLGCMGCVTGIAGGSIPHLQISFTFGLAVLVAIQVVGHVSGAHINPIVTIAAATLGNIPLIQVPIYFVGQFFGALVGYGLLKISTPANFLPIRSANDTRNVGVCSPGFGPDVSVLQGFLVEFLATLILALVCCGVWDSRNNNKHDSIPIRFGMTVAVLAMAAGPYTGANMNPVRSFAPALFNGDWNDHWVYWVAPILAGFIGALLYRLIFTVDPPPNRNEIPEGVPLNALNDKNKA